MSDTILASWRPGATRDALLGFLSRVDEIPPRERVAVFDNDGTLWSEKPNYTQLEFFVLELQRATELDPALAARPEFAAVLDGDRAAMAEIGMEAVATALLDLFEGISPREFDHRVERFFAEQRHRERGVPYRQTRYQPMLELLDELRSRGFDCYLASGGGAEFVRVISDDFYGVKPEGVVGTQIAYSFGHDADGRAQLLRTSTLAGAGANEGPAKPPNIQRILGRCPSVAGGNSAGDAEMLEMAMAYDGPSLALLVDHDDPDREYAYESVAGTFATDEPITETAARLGWTVVSIRDDWATVFSPS